MHAFLEKFACDKNYIVSLQLPYINVVTDIAKRALLL